MKGARSVLRPLRRRMQMVFQGNGLGCWIFPFRAHLGRAVRRGPGSRQAKLSAIARQLNERPRKTLLYQTPADKFAECVAATS